MKSLYKHLLNLILLLSAVFLLFGIEIQVNAAEIGVRYRTHIQNEGWSNYSYNGNLSGSVGKSLRLEAIEMIIDNNPNLEIKYSTHIESIGWQQYKANGQTSGTLGQSKRLEAIKIELSGSDSPMYDVYYRVHAQDYGWLGWTRNGHAAGTEGFGLRLEAIEVKVVRKGETVPTITNSFISNNPGKMVSYTTHIQDKGWMPYSYDGSMSGTEGLSKRMEAIRINLSNYLPSGSVIYRTHVEYNGWMNEVANGTLSGTEKESKRLEAITIRLEGTVSNYYGIEYRTHIQSVGWSEWSRNGAISGTTGRGLRLEAIEVRLYEKPQNPIEIPTPEPEKELIHSNYILTSNLWLREQPNPTSTGKVIMAKNTLVKVYEIVNGWAKVDFNGMPGYASASYMEHAYDVYKEPKPIILELTGLKDIYKNENVTGSGLTVAHDGIYGIKVLLDGKEIDVVRYDDPVASSKYPEYSNSNLAGYKFDIDYNLVTSGDHTLSVITESNYRNKETVLYKFLMTKNPSLVTIEGLKSGDSVPVNDVKISGLALADSGVSEVRYYINGVLTGNATIGLQSNAEAFPQYPQSGNAGYEFVLNPTQLKSNANTLKVELVSNDGSTEYNSVILMGETTDNYVFDSYQQSLKYYVDKEYINTQKYIGTGSLIWNKVKTNMDPSNFIYDEINKYIFMDLSYNVEDYQVTVETLDSMLNGKGILSGKGQTYLDAAIAYKINPFYLVAHSLLETGNGTSALATGQKIDIVYSTIGNINSPTTPVPAEDIDKLVYNVYGIRAFDGNAVLWGSQFAYASRWFSVEEAIYGGAQWISTNYIHRAKPQNTLYRMRFNLADNMTHQYATDIEWAKKQASRIKKQFDDMGVSAPKKFIVPTFMN